ncbi:MAG TPA: hypothetical protein VMQ65_08415 [Candidatus Limnocylindria bacterium]|nr:hypothetical protein [Candidatus Limnocylindria bacterium]
MPSYSPARRPAALAAALVLAVAACGTTTPSPSATSVATTGPTVPTGTARPPAEVYAEIRDAVAGIRGLQPTADVDPVTIDESVLHTNFEAEFDRAYTPTLLKDTEDLLIALGLLPPGSSLRAITLAFQAGQVAGYYSPEDDELFVVSRSGRVGGAEKATYAHEFTHQLQDQHFDLGALGIDASDQSDQALARLALVEGDATSVQTGWMTSFLDARELGEVLAAALDPVALEALRSAPAYLRDTATFPYEDGFAFVSRLLAGGGYAAVDAAYADPPDSTEQVLHPDLYLQRQPPIAVELPAGLAQDLGAGWTEAAQDTFGELILRTWLREGGVTIANARAASAGWGGDRLALLRGPNGAVAVALLTVWDTPADADEFAAAARLAVAQLPLGGSLGHAAGSSTVSIGIGANAAAIIAALGE